MHIVLVEPSKIGRRILTETLEAQNYSVISFEDGMEAFNYVNNNNAVDVLLTSFELAGKSGLELCWEFRHAIPEQEGIYIIVMSSTDSIDNIVQALDSGADDFIHKPPLPQELFARLRSAQRFIALQQKLRTMATRDSMTGLLNRRSFLKRAKAELHSAICESPMSLITLDIDRLKSINDIYGHDSGDVAIQKVAEIINSEKGFAGRLGGEEFALFLPNTTQVKAEQVAELLRVRIAGIKIEAEGEKFTPTSSFGVSSWFNSSDDKVEHVLNRADAALCDAKRQGRNQVVGAGLDIDFAEPEAEVCFAAE